MGHLPDSRALLEMHRCRQQNQAVGGPSWMYIRGDIDVGDNDRVRERYLSLVETKGSQRKQRDWQNVTIN